MTQKVNKLGLDTSEGIDFTNDVNIASSKSEDLVLNITQTNPLYSAKIILSSASTSTTFGHVQATDSYTWVRGDADTKKIVFSYDDIDIKNNSGILKHNFKSSSAGSATQYKQINDSLCSIDSSNTSYSRWRLVTKSNDSETGSNVGSDFGVYRYNDVGVLIDRPLWIYRSTGKVELTKIPTILESISSLSNDNSVITSKFFNRNMKSGGDKNYLINPFFQVNQEVNASPMLTTVAADGKFICDGWRVRSTSGTDKSVTFTCDPKGGSIVLPDSSTVLEQKILTEDIPFGVYVVSPVVSNASTSLTGSVTVYTAGNSVLATYPIAFSDMTKLTNVATVDNTANSSQPYGFGQPGPGVVIYLNGHVNQVAYIKVAITGPGTVYGCQVEVGEIPTRIEARQFQDELRRCKKFYQKSYDYSVKPGTLTESGATANRYPTSSGYITAGTFMEVSMRSIPTVLLYSTYVANTPNVLTCSVSSAPFGNTHSITYTVTNASSRSFQISLNNNPTDAIAIRYQWVADSRV